MSALIQQTKREPQTVFSRVLVGVDSSDESREAARQAAALAEGQLTLLAAYDIAATLADGTPIGAPVYYVGAPVSYIEDLQRDTAKEALSRARDDVAWAAPTGKIVRGGIWETLIREAEREKNTLIAVGAHGGGRMSGIVTGSVATNLIHKAPCSVLVARKNSDAFLRKIVVGIDGSPESAAAYAAASQLAERFETELVPMVALGRGEPVDRQLVDLFIGHHREELPDEPVQALVAGSADADLLVVGSRGLHGLKALGSVSERVAHEARSSVLIVRQPTWQRVSEKLAG
jgi:nucleotide-binding universal stress UspA family protein